MEIEVLAGSGIVAALVLNLNNQARLIKVSLNLKLINRHTEMRVHREVSIPIMLNKGRSHKSDQGIGVFSSSFYMTSGVAIGDESSIVLLSLQKMFNMT